MLKIMGYGVLALLVAVCALTAFAALSKPDTFKIERRLLIQAPPDKLWPLVSDLKGFHQWNPFGAKDPAAKIDFSPITSGPGAHYAWAGAVVGRGSMEITEAQNTAQNGAYVRFRLDFLKPFEAHNLGEFALRAEGAGTEVRWTMQGPSPLFNKVIDTVFNMDRMVGSDFEAGLSKLKVLAEQP